MPDVDTRPDARPDIRIDALLECTAGQEVCGEIRMQPVMDRCSQYETAAIEAMGGVGPALQLLPMNPSELAKKAATEGPAAALLAAFPPEMAQFATLFGNIAEAAKKDAALLASLFPTSKGGGSTPSRPPEKPEVNPPLNPTSSESPEGRQLASVPVAAQSQTAIGTASPSVSTLKPLPIRTGPPIEEIWHPDTDMNLFEIVSSRIAKSISRVLP